MKTKKIIKLNHAARLFDTPYHWLKQQAEAGKFPAIKADKTYLVLPKNVENFLLSLAEQGDGNE
jgi:hypothetical protein